MTQENMAHVMVRSYLNHQQVSHIQREEFLDTTIKSDSNNFSSKVSPLPPWRTPATSPRNRKSPLEFELETCGRKLKVVYDSMLNKNMSSLPFLKTFDPKIERVSRAEFVRVPSSHNRFEICYDVMKLPIEIDSELKINCSFYCTAFPEPKLFFGRSFGKKYIKSINLRTKLMILSNGKTEVQIKFRRLRYKEKSTMN